MDKSYVTMEQKQCVVCGELYDTGALLLDKRLRKVFDTCTVTSPGLCPEHQRLADDGYIALIETTDDTGEYRTGNIAHVRKDAFNELFSVTLDKDASPIVFVEDGIINKLGELNASTE